jgi:hypothetical protein
MPETAHSSNPAAAPATGQTGSPPAAGNRQPRQPEKKIGPFAGGVGVAIWINHAEGQDGTQRSFRSISINPRRFFDAKSQQWKDAPSFNPADLPCLIFSLQQAQAHCFTVPLPGETEAAAPEGESGGEVPF